MRATYALYNQRDKLSVHIAFPPPQMHPDHKQNSKNQLALNQNLYYMRAKQKQ